MSRFGATSQRRGRRGGYRGSAGFTLIEMLIVVLLVSVLVAVMPAVQGLKDAVVGLSEGPNKKLAPIAERLRFEANDLVDNPDSTQAIAWQVVVGAANADPVTGTLDPDALQALNVNLLEREANIVVLMGQLDATLGTPLAPAERKMLQDANSALSQALDAVRKMKAVIPLRLLVAP